MNMIIGFIVALVVIAGGAYWIGEQNGSSNAMMHDNTMMASSSDDMMASSSDEGMMGTSSDMMSSSSDEMMGTSSEGEMMH